MAEQGFCKPQVGGSSPLSGSILRLARVILKKQATDGRPYFTDVEVTLTEQSSDGRLLLRARPPKFAAANDIS